MSPPGPYEHCEESAFVGDFSDLAVLIAPVVHLLLNIPDPIPLLDPIKFTLVHLLLHLLKPVTDPRSILVHMIEPVLKALPLLLVKCKSEPLVLLLHGPHLFADPLMIFPGLIEREICLFIVTLHFADPVPCLIGRLDPLLQLVALNVSQTDLVPITVAILVTIPVLVSVTVTSFVLSLVAVLLSGNVALSGLLRFPFALPDGRQRRTEAEHTGHQKNCEYSALHFS